MTTLLFVTLISFGITLTIGLFNKLNPAKSGDDYMGQVMLVLSGGFTAICAVLSFIQWIV